MSELDAHQIICLCLGTLSGVCITLFFTTINPTFALTNILLINKVLWGMKKYYDNPSCKKDGRELVSRALLRFF